MAEDAEPRPSEESEAPDTGAERSGRSLTAWAAGAVALLALAGCAAVFVVAPQWRASQIEATADDVREDLDYMDRAIEAYFVDAGEYPSDLIPCLTTPSAYLTAEPLDPFTPAGVGRYSYARSPEGDDWILLSAGPDGVPDMTDLRQFFVGGPGAERALRDATWDPTNGARSAGDIWVRRRDR